MSVISYIFEKDIDKYEGVKEVTRLDSIQDVSTLIETFEDVKSKVGFENIKYVVSDDEGYYYFVISARVEDFDLFEFINNVYVEDMTVSCLNAKFLFPKKESRGIYDYSESADEEFSTSEQDIPTGYLDEDSLPYVRRDTLYLQSRKNGSNINIPDGGLVMGRSPKKVDYLVKDNGNVGRVHCKVYYGNNRLMVHDYDSLNGTFVNNRKVHSSRDVELVNGDVLFLADEEFRVVQ